MMMNVDSYEILTPESPALKAGGRRASVGRSEGALLGFLAPLAVAGPVPCACVRVSMCVCASVGMWVCIWVFCVYGNALIFASVYVVRMTKCVCIGFFNHAY